jgi:exodeoxyribonuclease V beta subunit
VTATGTIRVARPDSLPPADAKLVVVEASAGTGKTYFLEHRVVDLILAGAELGQILLVTFTEKAVAELRMRIRDLLDRLSRVDVDTEASNVWTIDDAARIRLRASVTAFDHAPIYTIHGFCHRILVEDAFAAQRLFEQAQVADEVAFDAAFSALLRERYACGEIERGLLRAFLETDRSVDRLRDMLLQCARAGVGRDARVRRRLDAGAVRAAVGALRQVFGTEGQRNVVQAALHSERKWAPARIAELGQALAGCPADAEPPQQLAMLDRIREAAELLAARSSKLPAEIGAALRGAISTVSLDEAIAAEMLPPLIARIIADKAERGLFDYDDMLQLVWRALRGPRKDELAARLRTRTPWVMIDEFQDTDPVQWNIFRSVWMHAGAKGLTIVGDPKQAIYGFRGADVATYVAAREEMLRAGAVRVPLDVNRRSTEALVAAVNQILIGNFAMPMLDRGITYDEPVKASGDVTCDDLRPPVSVFVLQSAGRGQIEANRAALATAIGESIEALRQAPPEWRVRGVAPPFALGQVMVLTRTNRDSTEIAAALRARGLPCALVEPEKLFDTREASELACVLAAIAAPRDRSARMRALRTRFFDVPWRELMQIVDAPDHHPLIARIFDWAQLASRRQYEALFRRLVEDSRFAERALVLGGGERALTNTWHLIEVLLAELSRSRSDLHELVVQLRRWIADDTGHLDERDIQRAETDADAVRILTIHKAKGLEAPFVFLYGGVSGGPKSQVHMLRDGAGRAVVVGRPDDSTQKLLDEEIEAENQRLAYVALTRAQVRLYLPLYGESVLQKHAAYQPIQRCVGPFVGPRAADARRLFQPQPIAVGGPELAPAPPDALAGFVAPPAPTVVELAPLPRTRGGLEMLSYTRLASDADAAIVAPQGDPLDIALEIHPSEFDTDDAGGEVGPSDLPPGASSGLLLHDVLEVADLALVRRVPDLEAWRTEPAVVEQLTAAARARGIASRFLPHAAELAYATLTAPLLLVDGVTLPPMIEAAALAREVEFAFPFPAVPEARGLVKGYIDALIAWPSAHGDDELWVLDYKSDVLGGCDGPRRLASATARVREHYGIQARLYALAADRMRGSRRLAGLLFAFVRYGIVVPVRIDDRQLASWTQWLGDLAVAPRPNRTGEARA